ncbi:hypothetical protein [Arthrobacter sp. TMS1-12-1]
MPTIEKTRSRLLTAQQEQFMVRLGRRSRPGQRVDGFVVAVGRKWVLLAQTMDGGFFDGYAAVRLREISRVRPDRSFEQQFAKTRPEWPPGVPSGRPIPDLDTTSGMLKSFLAPGVLFSIERDKKYDAVWIGVPNELTRRYLYLWEVRPDATWHDAPQGYARRSITVARIGDHYLEGLAAIAGPAPSAEFTDRKDVRARVSRAH